MIKRILKSIINRAYGFDIDSMNPNIVKSVYYYNESGTSPVYKTDGSVGADLTAYLGDRQSILIHPNDSLKISTGTIIELPEGYEGRLCSRSGLSSAGLLLMNGVGEVDYDYRGCISVPVKNISDQIIEIKNGERIAQLVIAKIEKVKFIDIVDPDLFSNTERGANGFGSTGSK